MISNPIYGKISNGNQTTKQLLNHNHIVEPLRTQPRQSIIDLMLFWLASRTEALKKPETMAMKTAMMV